MTQKYLIEQSVASEERKAAELRKLRFMTDYCHTQRCLRAYILDYFGQSGVVNDNVGADSGAGGGADSSAGGGGAEGADADKVAAGDENCNNCSNCLETGASEDITVEAQKIFSCIVRMQQRFGMKLVAQVLKGSANKRVLQMKFDRLSTYGIMKDRTEQEILDLMQLLIADGYIGTSEGQYPVLRLLPRAAEVLKGDARVHRKTYKITRTVEEDEAVFNKLREVRRAVAAREQIPPYMVFSDDTLRAMAAVQPKEKYELLQVKGVGESKLEKYGEDFLAALRDI